MADRILVLREGHLQQLADPHTLYHQPTNEFVARFIGSTPMNFLPVDKTTTPCTFHLVDTSWCFVVPAATWPPGTRSPQGAGHFTLGLRPEDIALQLTAEDHLLPAMLTLLEPLGREVLLSVTCGPHQLRVLVPAPCPLTPGTTVWLNLSRGPHHIFDPSTGLALRLG
jgi:multiple sugar transport system ATP-binding protein